jgi:predicted Rossmann fold nucleotide-binding protein DprA/Smf involved in DNA uptake
MIPELSSNSQAILLLTAPLVAGRSEPSPDLLTLGEYNRVARILREKQLQPADLIGPNAAEVVALCATILGRERLDSLLGRGFLLSQAVERWSARAIWIVSRADANYPRRLKTRLKEDAPPILYGCGDAALLDTGGLAVVGSRHVNDELTTYTEEVGRLTAEAHRTLISGAAKGIDRAAMHGALQAGGRVVGIMADSLERAALARDNREPLMEGRLVFISPYDPAAGFNVGHAMQRNKVIYALSDAALVVSSDFEKGGTWTGAIEQLKRLRFVPVFVRDGTEVCKGNLALLQRGAHPWPNPRTGAELIEAITTIAESVAAEPKQSTLSFVVRETPPAVATKTPPPLSPSETLFQTVQEILRCEMDEPRTEAQVAKLLAVSKAQAKSWLVRLVKAGLLEKLSKKPVRYRPTTSADRLL